MYTIVWSFQVRADAEPEFENAYGAQGDWVQLFRRAPGYVGTDLARSLSHGHSFYTVDCWESEQHFRDFRDTFQEQYEELDRLLEGLTESERLVAADTRE